MIGMVCAPLPGERWWDCCAGGGGKTLQLASLLQRKGVVVATDIREYKLDDLKMRARRAGFPNIRRSPWDGKAPRKKKAGLYDGVLVDAPCSCSGVWRRNPDAKWNTDEAEIAEMSDLQLKILTAASAGVKPGGVLVYGTCSLFDPENRTVVSKFLESHPDFTLESFADPLSGKLCQGTLQIRPWDSDSDSMFAARMRRSAAAKTEN
jgi:16S rRNA (cytosine967-C5)-methyltransferase